MEDAGCCIVVEEVKFWAVAEEDGLLPLVDWDGILALAEDTGRLAVTEEVFGRGGGFSAPLAEKNECGALVESAGL